MWTIGFKERDDSLISLHQTTTFISINKILTFELAPQDGSLPPVEISFTVRKDDNKEKFLAEMSPLVDRKATLTYYNPGSGSSGLFDPYTILENDAYYFKVMFQTIVLGGGDTFQLTLEFFVQKK